MSKPVVAALRLKSTGQTLELSRDSVLLVGRGSFAVQVESTGDKVIITRLGANRSLMDGKILEKNTPVPLENGALVTLLESEYQVTVEIPPINNTPTVNNNKPKEGEEQKKKSVILNPGVKAVLQQQQQRINSTPKSPLKPSIAAMTRSHSFLGAAPPRRESPRLAQKEKEAENARKEADNARKEETMRTLEEEEQQQQHASEEDEATSESEDEDMAHQDSFAVSDESSMICSDLSDLDGGRDDKDCVEIKDE
ncbi:MAG: hypothetical protein J3Q66DRAFT_402651 [Benniella sp.]|nr:MAG: hypothetical protein J3Q66DRAFT_402651 [Benniella sp.]